MVTAATNTGAPGNVVEVSDRSFMVGVDIDYAAQQQFGSVEKNIPPRPFFDPSEETIERLHELAADYFEHEVVG
jgi:phage gpG-like protein